MSSSKAHCPFSTSPTLYPILRLFQRRELRLRQVFRIMVHRYSMEYSGTIVGLFRRISVHTCACNFHCIHTIHIHVHVGVHADFHDMCFMIGSIYLLRCTLPILTCTPALFPVHQEKHLPVLSTLVCTIIGHGGLRSGFPGSRTHPAQQH